jgi:hypothetical protein
MEQGVEQPRTPSRLRLWVSAFALVAANAVPLVGLLFWEWSLFSIMLSYWLENVVIGMFQVQKLRFAEAYRNETGGQWNFFVLNFGIFTFVHGIFVFILFQDGEIVRALRAALPVVLGLVVSHAVSYYENFLNRREYQRFTVNQLFAQPYPRLFALHLTIIGGGFFVRGIGGSVITLSLLVLLKTAIDLVLHIRKHRSGKESFLFVQRKNPLT